MKTRLLIIIGIIITGVIIASTIGTIEYQSVYNQNCNSDGGYVVGFLRCTYIHEDFAEPRITGKMAREICSITGGECPPNYIANIQEDGSVMVGITISDTVIEKQFVFIIKNNTLSYTKTLYENGNRILDCNIPDNPHKEYQCFRDAFSNCQLAKVDPDQYTIEGSSIYTNVTITDDCKIYGIIDTATDVHGDRGIITSTCETLIDNQYGWTITDCDAFNYPEMQFNYEMQLYPQIIECEENGNTWVRERLECVVD